MEDTIPQEDIYILDTETATLGKGVMEIAWLRVNNQLEVLDEFRTLVNPEMPVNPGAFGVHGISDDDVKDSPLTADVVKVLNSKSLCVGHNINYDIRVLKDYWVPEDSFCTLALARAHIKGTTNHKLETLQRELTLPVQDSHSALGDVRTCRDVILHVMELTGYTFPELRLRSKVRKVIHTMPFGKWKGQPLLKIDKGYRSWLLEQSDLEPDLRYSLEKLKNI